MVQTFMLNMKQQRALFGWSCLWGYQVDTARDGAGRLVEHGTIQSYCLQTNRGRSLDQKIRYFVILEVISEQRNRELAGARSNIEGEALHTRHRQRARKRRQWASARPVCYYVQIRVDICLFNVRYLWAESVRVRLETFKRIVFLVPNIQTNKSRKKNTTSTFWQSTCAITDRGNEISLVSLEIR